jgi:4'-phosphopantetheinyl transferase
MTAQPRAALLLRAADPAPWAPAFFAAALALLPPAMRGEVHELRRWQDRQARILGRLLLRAGLARLGLDAGLDAWTRDAAGRPRIAGLATDFNISHCAGLALCAIRPAGQVGVDVEPLVLRDPEGLRLGFGPEEWTEIQAAADPERTLLRLWTAKEAALKADGRGLGVEPANVDARGAEVRVGGTVWRVARPDVGAGWICALATDRPVDVVLLDYSPEGLLNTTCARSPGSACG